jgi:hypothetical protein
VVRTDGERLTFARALARTLLKFVPWELSHTLIWQIRFAQPQEMALINMGFGYREHTSCRRGSVGS